MAGAKLAGAVAAQTAAAREDLEARTGRSYRPLGGRKSGTGRPTGGRQVAPGYQAAGRARQQAKARDQVLVVVGSGARGAGAHVSEGRAEGRAEVHAAVRARASVAPGSSRPGPPKECDVAAEESSSTEVDEESPVAVQEALPAAVPLAGVVLAAPVAVRQVVPCIPAGM